jgi:hypothetical protein
LAAGAVSLVFVSWQLAIVPFAALVAIGLAFSAWPRLRARRRHDGEPVPAVAP